MQAIHSIYAGDEDWTELLAEFIEVIPDRIESIQAAINHEHVDELICLVHQLRGACGSYGYQTLTPLATKIELDLRAGNRLDELQGDLHTFLESLGTLTDQPQ